MKTYDVTPHKNCLGETVLMMGPCIHFERVIWKIIPKLSILIPSYLKNGDSVMDNMLDYQFRERMICPPLLQSFG